MFRIEPTYKQLINYLKGLLSNRERHDLEQEMMRDVFDEEAFEGLNQLSADELEADMDILTNRLEDRIEPRKRRNLNVFYRIAAAIVLLVGVGGILFVVFRTPSENLITQENNHSVKQAPVVTAPAEALKSPVTEVKKSGEIRKSDQAPVMTESRVKSAAVAATDTLPTLAMSYIGFKPLELNSKEIAGKDIIMTEDLMALNEVVVTGYGRNLRSQLSGTVAGVEVKDISNTGEPVPYNFIKPVPPGGSLKAFKKWVDDRLDYTLLKSFPGRQRIQVNLTVHANGSISDISIRETVPSPVAEEYKRVITQSPPWEPALKDSIPVEAQVVIRFVIEIN